MAQPRILLVVGGGIAAYKACELVRLIKKGGGEVTCVLTEGGAQFVTPMSLAAEVANAEVIALLLEAGANADSPNLDGQTALQAVARTGNLKAAQLLIDAGATIDARERFGGQTALMWASARRHPEMMELLIAKGADVNARSAVRDYQRHVTAEGRPKSLDSGIQTIDGDLQLFHAVITQLLLSKYVLQFSSHPLQVFFVKIHEPHRVSFRLHQEKKTKQRRKKVFIQKRRKKKNLSIRTSHILELLSIHQIVSIRVVRKSIPRKHVHHSQTECPSYIKTPKHTGLVETSSPQEYLLPRCLQKGASETRTLDPPEQRNE